MLNKGDLFIVPVSGQYFNNGRWFDNTVHKGIVFRCNGTQGQLIYAEVAGTTEKRYGSPVGEKHTIVQKDGVKIEKANRDTIEAAGLTEDKKPEVTFDHEMLRKASVDALSKQKDKAYWKFIEDYIQWLKTEAVTNKEAVKVLAAFIEAEANLTDKADSDVAKSATNLLNILESIEVVNKFYDGIKK